MGRRVRRLIAPSLIAASLAAVVVTGMHAGETLPPTQSRAKVTNVDTSKGCKHTVHWCTGQRAAGTGRVILTIKLPTNP